MKGYNKRLETPCVYLSSGTSILKPKVEWLSVEDEEALGKSKALNSISNGVYKNIFRLINTCNEAKEAWENQKPLMKAHPKFVCQGCSLSQPNLRILE